MNSDTHKKRSSNGLLIFLIIIAALFVVAAIKNPSASEGRKMVKDFIAEKADDELRSTMTDDSSSGLAVLGSLIGLNMMSTIIDTFIDIQVDDCIVFSTFNCTIRDKEDLGKSIVSGVILFGKIIPLNSDMESDVADDDSEETADE